ncbi:MAG: cytoplasmic protein, partial [Deltaproteobacteria bacterium CG_4_8_14_3_um_filter_43_13]
MVKDELTFNHLVGSILEIHKHLASQARRALNISLTLRNWMIGLYIAEFELRGVDRSV